MTDACYDVSRQVRIASASLVIHPFPTFPYLFHHHERNGAQYSRADPNGGTGISTAPHWKGPYTRLFLPIKVSSHAPQGYNFSLVRCGEDPFIYQDFRGTWRVLCHGGTEKVGWSKQFPEAKIETIGLVTEPKIRLTTERGYRQPAPGAAN